MKLFTLNTHSLQESEFMQKTEWFVEGILREKPDMIALQEVNQTMEAAVAEEAMREGEYRMATQIPIKKDNYAAQIAQRLRQAGVDCYWVWLPVKCGYGKYDEGVALLSLGRRITTAQAFSISKNNAYDNWRTRAVLGVQVEGCEDWFYSVHFGWWDDREEPFVAQWMRLKECIAQQRVKGTVWLMGDFNAPDLFQEQSYAYIRSDGWFDTHQIAKQKGNDFTVLGSIDGWQGKLPDRNIQGMRLDYIFCNRQKEILSSQLMFDGKEDPVVSDHFGVLIHVKENR